MASGEPSPDSKNQMQMICQLCGRDMKSDCGQEQRVNYQKQVDPLKIPYSQIIPDSRYDEDLRDERRRKGKNIDNKKPAPHQVCIPIPVVTGKTCEGTAQNAPAKAENNATKEKEKETAPTGSSSVTKASCMPGGCSPQPVKMMLCLPCPPPDGIGGSSDSGCGTSNDKPRDYTYRCESRELRGGNLYSCCHCVKRNGLQHDCPRTPCQGRPACLTKPWPDCWASGGCHGIDYSREKGVKRYDPCLQQRFDKKQCKPPGAPKPTDGGGNMMVVVCPKPAKC